MKLMSESELRALLRQPHYYCPQCDELVPNDDVVFVIDPSWSGEPIRYKHAMCRSWLEVLE